ncbi:pyridoxamine 5'-phosphate oxidase family protein [Marivirga sp.]|uniref:pyridoxamine 5'-phosphate oxidase family protein n=1 Tax=Marivirga sp. TaxID=2018662 RepID=UPI002D8109CC|nr:pyridoxamine 5'-phosphate oxidase family protein [Marivirga sp.]HET8859617.1 pyridoxamine 5'-phosphate oxidase family protein [Marivirga sp.]
MSLIESKDSLADIKSTLLNTLNRAGNDKRSAFRFIILNTISDGFPNSRYVVLRKFKTDTQALFIYTDSRSNKIKEIEEDPLASVLAYDKQKKCQIKLKGKISIHHKDKIAEQHWTALQGGQESYNTEKQPGKKVDSLKDSHQMKSEFDDEYFAVLVLKVSQAEILQLNGDGHIRALFDFEKTEASYLVP